MIDKLADMFAVGKQDSLGRGKLADMLVADMFAASKQDSLVRGKLAGMLVAGKQN